MGQEGCQIRHQMLPGSQLSWDDSKRDMRRPLVVDKAYCTLVNISLAPVTAWEMLSTIPRRRLHLCKEQEHALGGIADKSALILASRVGGRHSQWMWLSKCHPKITFQMDQDVYPCRSFLCEIASFLTKSQAPCDVGWLMSITVAWSLLGRCQSFGGSCLCEGL